MYRIEYPDDCINLQKFMLERLNQYADLPEVQQIWERISEHRCAGWLGVDCHSESALLEMLKDELNIF